MRISERILGLAITNMVHAARYMRGHPVDQITEEQALEVVRQLGAALTELHDLPIKT